MYTIIWAVASAIPPFRTLITSVGLKQFHAKMYTHHTLDRSDRNSQWYRVHLSTRHLRPAKLVVFTILYYTFIHNNNMGHYSWAAYYFS